MARDPRSGMPLGLFVGVMLLGCVPTLDHIPCVVDANCPGEQPYCRGGFCVGTAPDPIVANPDAVDGGTTGDAGAPADAGDSVGGGPSGGGSGTGGGDGTSDGPSLVITKPERDGVCGSICAGAIVRAVDSQLDFSGTVDDSSGLSGPLTVSVSRAGATLVTNSIEPSGSGWSWTWDTGGLADDGETYAFSISATNAHGKQSIATRTVWVDRTAPSTTSFLPAPGAAGVWPLDPITVTFSEPLSPQSVSDSSVTVLSNAAVPVTKRLSLSSDGRTLAIKLLTPPSVAGQLEGAFANGMGALTDRVGNPLAAPSASWRWSVMPIWVDLAQRPASYVASLGVTGDDRGNALVAQVVESPMGILLKVWQVGATGWTDWTASGGVRGSLEGYTVNSCVISLDGSPTPFVAAHSGRNTLPTVARREPDGGSWTQLSSQMNTPKGVSALRIGADGNPMVAWIDGASAQVAHWSGTEWTSWGALNNANASAAVHVTLGLGAGKAPLVGWVEKSDGGLSSLLVAGWTGGGWLRLGQAGATELQANSSATIGVPVLGVTSQGRPVAVWTERGAADGGYNPVANVYTSTLVDGVRWQRTALGSPCIGTFVLDPLDGIIDVCPDTTSRWDGVEWVSLGRTLPVGYLQSDLVVGSSSRSWPVIVWMEGTVATSTFRARVFNR